MSHDDLDLRPHQRPHIVYRVFDAQDRLLYIGCTSEIGQRMAIHHCWGNNGSEASVFITYYGKRVETTQYPDRATARAAEREAIKAEAPWFNRQHNPQRFTRKRGGPWERIGAEYEPVGGIYGRPIEEAS